MNQFLPQGAEAPKENSNYMKLIEGVIKFRIVSPAIYGYEYWNNDNKPVRVKKYPQGTPENIRMEKDSNGVEKFDIKHFWAFKVLDREDNRVKIFEITQNGVKRAIESLIQNEDWGEPFGYDIKITGEGKGLDRRYTVNPVPHKELTAEEKSIVARTEINLEALYTGENPFGENKASLEEEIGDVPF